MIDYDLLVDEVMLFLLGGQVPGQEQGVFPAELNLDLFVDDGPVYVPEVVDDDLFVEVGDGPYYHEMEDLDLEVSGDQDDESTPVQRVYQAMITGIERTIARINELECIATEEELTEFLDWVGAGGILGWDDVQVLINVLTPEELREALDVFPEVVREG